MLKSTTVFRAATHNDAPLAAAIGSVADPNHPVIAEELLAIWVNTVQGSTVRRFFVQQAGRDLGWL